MDDRDFIIRSLELAIGSQRKMCADNLGFMLSQDELGEVYDYIGAWYVEHGDYKSKTGRRREIRYCPNCDIKNGDGIKLITLHSLAIRYHRCPKCGRVWRRTDA